MSGSLRGGVLALVALLLGSVPPTGDARQVAISGPTTTSTPSPLGVQTRSSGTIAIDDQALERAALAVVHGEEVVLISLDGAELGRGQREGWYPDNPDRGVALEPVPGGWAVSQPAARDEMGGGCGAIHGAGGLWATACGAEWSEPTEIRIIAPGNTSRLLAGAVDPDGSWRYALPSPDGRWVLAQWSGACEVPTAYVFPSAGGEGRPVDGTGAGTIAVGWTPDGRAVVGFMPGGCGADTEPGIYLVDPRTRQRRRISHDYEAAMLVPPS